VRREEAILCLPKTTVLVDTSAGAIEVGANWMRRFADDGCADSR
jgi:hypothetical protein